MDAAAKRLHSRGERFQGAVRVLFVVMLEGIVRLRSAASNQVEACEPRNYGFIVF